jgi:hypothetical protein
MQLNQNTLVMFLFSVVFLYVMRTITRKPPIQVQVIAEETDETSSTPESIIGGKYVVTPNHSNMLKVKPFYKMRHHRARYPLLKRD